MGLKPVAGQSINDNLIEVDVVALYDWDPCEAPESPTFVTSCTAASIESLLEIGQLYDGIFDELGLSYVVFDDFELEPGMEHTLGTLEVPADHFFLVKYWIAPVDDSVPPCQVIMQGSFWDEEDEEPVSTLQTSWGRVKTQYR